MFKILQMLRDINTWRVINWYVREDDNVLVVKIPLSDEDAQMIRDMQALFAPVNDEED